MEEQMKFEEATKLSDLLEIAQRDLKQIEKDPRYLVRMGTWHSAARDGKCAVCLAGAVMAVSLEIPHGTKVRPFDRSHFSQRSWRKLEAINYARSGDISAALTSLDYALNTTSTVPRGLDRDLILYIESQTDFHVSIKVLIKNLRAEGL